MKVTVEYVDQFPCHMKFWDFQNCFDIISTSRNSLRGALPLKVIWFFSKLNVLFLWFIAESRYVWKHSFLITIYIALGCDSKQIFKRSWSRIGKYIQLEAFCSREHVFANCSRRIDYSQKKTYVCSTLLFHKHCIQIDVTKLFRE